MNDGNPTLRDLLTILESSGMSTAKENVLRKTSISRPEFLDYEEPDHIPRPAEMLAASEIFYDNQSLLVYGEIGVGKTYFVKRLLNIYLDVMPDSPRKITLWIDFNNFSSSLLEICTKLGISCEGRRTYDLVITLINSQPDFVVLDGFSLAHKACGKYFAYCQKFQKEYYYKLIVITEDKEECADFDLAIQIEPFDADQALKFVPQASTFPHEIIEYCDGNAALLNIFRRLVHDEVYSPQSPAKILSRLVALGAKHVSPIFKQELEAVIPNTEADEGYEGEESNGTIVKKSSLFAELQRKIAAKSMSQDIEQKIIPSSLKEKSPLLLDAKLQQFLEKQKAKEDSSHAPVDIDNFPTNSLGLKIDQSNSTHAIVHFPSDDTVEIVPTSWLNDQATHCQFPPTGEKGVKKIKKRSGAPLNHWAVYEAAVLKYFESYETTAAEKLPRAITGNKFSDSEIHSGTRTKISSSTLPAILLVPPTTNPPEIISALGQDNDNEGTTYFILPGYDGNLILVSPEGQTQGITPSTTNSIPGSNNSIKYCTAKNLNFMIDNQDFYAQNQHGRQLNNILNLLNTRGNDLPEIEDLLFSFPGQFFPLRTLASLDSLEQMLKGLAPRRELNNVLLGSGGDNLEECLELMARYLCSDELLSRPSYQGRSGKKSFLIYPQLNQAIFESLSTKLVPCLLQENLLMKPYQKFLKRAADRYMKKMKASPSFTPLNPENTVGQNNETP
ncbi:hypothetical protein Fcan01_16632 [Folsomia candida]|uniref:DUF4806 domain-containing protein n=2 Tax=Folsomia candida TaxID=158441 RepID=A0A226DX36_FOLCA|nr:hypothetical protein Fcan01_16632 [Folsomia candida]